MSEIQIVVNQLDHTTSHAQAREHSVTIDRPQDKGGQNKGPLGGEIFLPGWEIGQSALLIFIW